MKQITKVQATGSINEMIAELKAAKNQMLKAGSYVIQLSNTQRRQNLMDAVDKWNRHHYKLALTFMKLRFSESVLSAQDRKRLRAICQTEVKNAQTFNSKVMSTVRLVVDPAIDQDTTNSGT